MESEEGCHLAMEEWGGKLIVRTGTNGGKGGLGEDGGSKDFASPGDGGGGERDDGV